MLPTESYEDLLNRIKSLEHKLEWFKESEKKLRQSEEKYRLLVENADDSIFIVQDGIIKFANPKTYELTGYTEDELKSFNFIQIIHPYDKYMVFKKHEKSQAGLNSFTNLPFRMLSKSGREHWVQLSTASIIWNNNPASVHFLRDISNQKKLEGMLRQAQKMESIGTLAGGIAHDFNNILAAMLGYTEIVVYELKSQPKLQKSLNEVLIAGERAKELVKQILTFSRQGIHDFKPLNIGSIIKEALKLLRATLPASIEIQEQIGDRTLMAMANPSEIHQVIMNLCTNAFHAMVDGKGILKIHLDLVYLGDDHMNQYHDISPGEYIKLTVSDTGHGMPPEIIEKVYDPYFTTKKHDKGTGLGLAVTHGIVKKHRGYIFCSSKPGIGTIFNVFLPILENTNEVIQPLETKNIPHGSEHILFVDDESQITQLHNELLKRLGYRVTVETDSLNALQKFKTSPSIFDMVITDMTMPKLTGEMLAREIFKIRPNIPVIICTGFNENISYKSATDLGICKLMAKPIGMSELANTVREIFDG